MSYRVTATRWEHGWELHIEDVGVTQSRSLATAEATVRDYLALDEYEDADTAEIVITPELDADLVAEAEAAREATRTAQVAVNDAAAKSRRAVIGFTKEIESRSTPIISAAAALSCFRSDWSLSAQ